MFGNVTNAFYQIYFTYRGLFGWLNWQAYTSNVLFRPVLFLLIFTLVGRYSRDPQAAERYIIGMSVFAVVWMLSGGILSGFANERSFGTLPYIFSSRGSRLVHYFSRGVLHYPNGLLSFGTCLIVAWLLLELDLSRVNWLASLSAVFLIAASSTAFMLLMGSISLVYRDWFNVQAIINGVLLTLTGVIIPTTSLPHFLSEVGQVFPLTHGLTAFRAAFEGATVPTVGDDLLRELFVGVGYAVAGYLLFRFVEIQAKRHGTMEFAG